MPNLSERKLTLIVTVILAFVLVLSVSLVVFMMRGHDELSRIKESQTQEAQFLLSTLDFKTEQQRITLYVRDIILKEWKRMGYKRGGYDKAFELSSIIVKESFKYPYMPPPQMALLLTAMLKQESCFLDSVKSTHGALGIAQFMPSTGRIMARILGMEYSDSLLSKPDVAIRMQAVYLDILLTTHDYKIEPSLAEYNGGTWSAIYWKTDRSRLNPETVKYVPEIMERYQGYMKAYKTYQVSLKATETTETAEEK